jgi:hypothetical protein
MSVDDAWNSGGKGAVNKGTAKNSGPGFRVVCTGVYEALPIWAILQLLDAQVGTVWSYTVAGRCGYRDQHAHTFTRCPVLIAKRGETKMSNQKVMTTMSRISHLHHNSDSFLVCGCVKT